MTILEKYTKEELELLLKESSSFRQFLIKIGSSSDGSGAYNSIKKQLSKLEIVIPLFESNFYFKSNVRINDEFIFKQNSTYNRSHLKDRIIKNNLIEYKCNKCENNGKWLNNNLVLQLDHINGVNNDNRLENLRFLCPNCHSQTETFAGKKFKKEKIPIKVSKDIALEEKIKEKKVSKRKKTKICLCGVKITNSSNLCKNCNNLLQRKNERPEYESLILQIEELGYTGTGRKYGVSDNTIRKWKKQYEKLK